MNNKSSLCHSHNMHSNYIGKGATYFCISTNIVLLPPTLVFYLVQQKDWNERSIKMYVNALYVSTSASKGTLRPYCRCWEVKKHLHSNLRYISNSPKIWIMLTLLFTTQFIKFLQKLMYRYARYVHTIFYSHYIPWPSLIKCVVCEAHDDWRDNDNPLHQHHIIF